VVEDEQTRKFIDELYLDMFGKLYSYAMTVLRDESMAEEAVQETFRVVCIKPRELMESRNPRGYLVVTLKNVIRNMRAAKARYARYIVDAESVDVENIEGGKNEEFYEDFYINIVGIEDYKLLKCMAIDGYTVGEIAQKLGITAGACYKRIERAKKKLKKYLEKNKN
jgi:RNA polymerase sigma-70 factor (ECF subfamily)